NPMARVMVQRTTTLVLFRMQKDTYPSKFEESFILEMYKSARIYHGLTRSQIEEIDRIIKAYNLRHKGHQLPLRFTSQAFPLGSRGARELLSTDGPFYLDLSHGKATFDTESQSQVVVDQRYPTKAIVIPEGIEEHLTDRVTDAFWTSYTSMGMNGK